MFLKVLASLACLLGLSYGACPPIMSRSQWGARPPVAITPMTLPVPYTVIHHSVMGDGNCTDLHSCILTVKEIQDFHLDDRGWNDIGYQFLIGSDGTVFEGRGWDRQGAHAPPYNGNSIGICLIGDFTDKLPPQAQMDAAQLLIECGVENNWIIEDYTLFGHRDTGSTECPGHYLYEEILTWPNKGEP